MEYSDQAFVTLATNDSYCKGALVLGHSLRQTKTRRKLVIIIGSYVSDNARKALSEVFDKIIEVDVLNSHDTAHLALLKRPELGITFTKIHCWNLTQYAKCVFMDADTMVLQNIDDLFLREELSAAPDSGWPDNFNSGVFVYRPSADTYNKLLAMAVKDGSFDGGDQGLLNMYFSDWSTADIKTHLPFLYNLHVTISYTYAPAFKRFGSNAKVVHFIGPSKPWSQFQSSYQGVGFHQYFNQWKDIYRNNVMRHFEKSDESSNSSTHVKSSPNNGDHGHTPHDEHHHSNGNSEPPSHYKKNSNVHSDTSFHPSSSFNNDQVNQKESFVSHDFISDPHFSNNISVDSTLEFDPPASNISQNANNNHSHEEIIAPQYSPAVELPHESNSSPTSQDENNNNCLHVELVVHDEKSVETETVVLKKNAVAKFETTRVDGSHSELTDSKMAECVVSPPIHNIHENRVSPHADKVKCIELVNNGLIDETISQNVDGMGTTEHDRVNATLAAVYDNLNSVVNQNSSYFQEETAAEKELRLKREVQEHRKAWESGSIDYMGRDSFENILSRLNSSLK